MAKISKKSISILLICMLVAALGMTGCGGNDNGGDTEMIKIGIMQFGEFEALQNANKGFQDGLAELGYVEGENVTFNYLSAAADTANCPTIADTLINDGSDLILAIATPSASAVKEKTSDIKTLKDLTNKSVILPVPRSSHRRPLEKILSINSVKLNNVVSIENSETIIQAVKQGIGIGYVLRNMIEEDVRNGCLKFINIKEELPKVVLNLIYVENYLGVVPKNYINRYILKEDSHNQ